MVVGGSDSSSVTSLFFDEEFLDTADIELTDVSGAVDAIAGDLDTAGLVALGLPLEAEADATFALGEGDIVARMEVFLAGSGAVADVSFTVASELAA